MKKSVRLLSIIGVLVLLLGAVGAAGAKPSGTVNVQILALNDFHGNLQPPAGSAGRIGTVNAGGVEYLATHVNALRATNPNTVFVSAGDMIGASPLISALFHDEPSIEAFNLMGLDFNAVGNHEFDEGIYELIRMQEGGCHPVDGCLDGDDFAGADFRFLAANVTWQKNGKTVFPAYKTKSFNGVHVAFIGMTLEGTPTIVTPSGISELDFHDEADTVNALIPELKQKGIETIVVVIHEGGFPAGGYNECPGISGPIVDIVERTSDEVDLFITGHTHQAYNCVIDGRPVTSSASFGRVVTDIDLVIDRSTGDMVSATANNNIVTRNVPLNPFLTALVTKYNNLSAPLSNRVIGSITATITRTPNDAGESALGDVIADAQLAATADPAFGGAVVAFMNPGGIRADFTYAASGSEGDGNVTYGEAFTVQPFGNSLVTMTLTGAQIDALLEQQATAGSDGLGRTLQISHTLTYAWNASAPNGSKVDIASIMINGVPIDPNASYRVTVNSFLADGGDGFAVLLQGTDRLGGEVDLDALVTYFENNSPIAPGPQNRITLIP
ncbi:MAG TPA: bifunctional metallophosphatase/5'-nucleotidase [Anaerolineales bacterium]|nr:bifunctional metallophosphatase/5'-nucleotidase [Anaerolineales bacterium]